MHVDSTAIAFAGLGSTLVGGAIWWWHRVESLREKFPAEVERLDGRIDGITDRVGRLEQHEDVREARGRK